MSSFRAGTQERRRREGDTWIALDVYCSVHRDSWLVRPCMSTTETGQQPRTWIEGPGGGHQRGSDFHLGSPLQFKYAPPCRACKRAGPQWSIDRVNGLLAQVAQPGLHQIWRVSDDVLSRLLAQPRSKVTVDMLDAVASACRFAG